MQVKLCPKCGSENKPDKASCSGCYASLEGVAPTEGKESPAPAQAQPVAARPPAAQPPSSSGPAAVNDGPPPPNYGPPPGAPNTYGPSFNERRSAPIKRGPNWGAIVLVVLLLGGAGFAGWWFFLKPASPEAVVQKFRSATSARDYDSFKSCLCQGNIAMMQKTPGGEQAIKDEWAKAPKPTPKKDENYEFTTTYENSGAQAVVEMKPKEQSGLPAGMTGTEFVLLQEDGKWKIDLQATTMRMMKKRFPNGIPGMRRP